jgi:hypothetical protein
MGPSHYPLQPLGYPIPYATDSDSPVAHHQIPSFGRGSAVDARPPNRGDDAPRTKSHAGDRPPSHEDGRHLKSHEGGCSPPGTVGRNWSILGLNENNDIHFTIISELSKTPYERPSVDRPTGRSTHDRPHQNKDQDVVTVRPP